MNMEKASLKLFRCLFFVYVANVIGKTSFSAATVALVSEKVLTKNSGRFRQWAFLGFFCWVLNI